MKKVNYKSLNILIILAIVYVLFLMRDLWIGVFFKVISLLKTFSAKAKNKIIQTKQIILL